jgi:hypothetical protein
VAAGFEITTGSLTAGAKRLRDLGGRIKAGTRAALERLGPQLVMIAAEEMRAAKPELHPFTAMRKGSSVPLAGGPLEAALTYRVVSSDLGPAVWFGIPASAGEINLIARVQEHGVTIDVTPAMRGFLSSQGLHLRADTQSVVIPPRPFIAPTLRRAREGRMVRTAIVDALREAWRG